MKQSTYKIRAESSSGMYIFRMTDFDFFFIPGLLMKRMNRIFRTGENHNHQAEVSVYSPIHVADTKVNMYT